ncbi:MAG: hypothetical protein BWY63_03025 [Chloroflexi bacterium ADurb.Bin360]|nr:MAG: hypothetical protein BWY63_03025 [Chloroflexi bacterium ADurb.Bin360]
MIRNLEFLYLVLRVVLDDDAQGAQDRHRPQRARIQILADAVFQQPQIHHAVGFGDADALREIPDGFGGIAATAQSRECRHAGVIPTADVPTLHEAQQPTLAHDRVGEIEPGKFNLLRVVDAQLVKVPIIERAMVLELERADGVGDALDGILQPVRPIVHGVDAPGIARAVMARVQDAVHHGVAQVEVGRAHVNFGAQHPRTIGKFSRAHATEEVKVLLDGAVAIGAILTRFGERAAILANLLGAQIIHVSHALLDEVLSPEVHLFEIVGGEEWFIREFGNQPAHIRHDGFDVFFFFLHRVGVIEAQVEFAAVIARNAGVEADRFAVPDVEIAVRFRREAGVDPPTETTRAIVLVDERTDEVN